MFPLQVRRVFWKLLELCPTPEAAVAADTAAIRDIIAPLGLHNKRAVAVQRLSQDYLQKEVGAWVCAAQRTCNSTRGACGRWSHGQCGSSTKGAAYSSVCFWLFDLHCSSWSLGSVLQAATVAGLCFSIGCAGRGMCRVAGVLTGCGCVAGAALVLQWACPTELYGIGKYAAGEPAAVSDQAEGKRPGWG